MITFSYFDRILASKAYLNGAYSLGVTFLLHRVICSLSLLVGEGNGCTYCFYDGYNFDITSYFIDHVFWAATFQ